MQKKSGFSFAFPFLFRNFADTYAKTMKRILAIIGCAVIVGTVNAQDQKNDSTKVAIGYSLGSQRTMAGAIEKLGEKRMSKGLIISPLDALSGQAAGVQVQTVGHQETMVSAVRVRGTTSLTGGNDPLVIIDGVTSNLATLSTIYPADIESFTILKDAAETSQYGSRGAAGVIEVATKKGRSRQSSRPTATETTLPSSTSRRKPSITA